MEFVPQTHENRISGETTATGRLLHEIEVQARGGPNVEQPTAAMFKALWQEKDDPYVAYLLDEAAGHALVRRGVSVGAAVSALRTSFVDYFRARRQQDNEQEFDDSSMTSAEDWKPEFDKLKHDLSVHGQRNMAVAHLQSDITFREASTPIKERYFPAALVAHLADERMEGRPWRVLDIGSSVPAGALQLRYQSEFPMSFASVEELDKQGEVKGNLTDKANQILRLPQFIGEIVCVDQFPVFNEKFQRYDEGSVEFAFSGLRPSERNNPDYFNDVKALVDKKRKYIDGQLNPGYDPHNGVIFHQANLLHDVDLGDFKDAHPEPFDLIVMNYLTQELAPRDQIRLDEITDQLMSPVGIKIYNHQAYIDRKARTRPAPIKALRHYESYAVNPWSSNMHLRDNLHPTPGLQEVINYFDNRCQSLRMSAFGRLVVNGELYPLPDLVRHF